MQKFQRLFAAMAASLGSILPSKADAIYHSTGSGSWPGFVRPSTMRMWYVGRTQTSEYRPHQGEKECARRVAKGQAPFEYNKEWEQRQARGLLPSHYYLAS